MPVDKESRKLNLYGRRWNKVTEKYTEQAAVKMKEQKIFSKNSTYQLIEVLKTNRNKRYRQNSFLVEGVRSLNEAVKNGWRRLPEQMLP